MHQMLWKFNTRAHAGVWNFAVSAIDVALWDIKGKFFKVPIWRLLGAAQKSLPAYITFGLRAALLDGGIAAWPGLLDRDPVHPAPASFTAAPWPEESLVQADDLEAWAGIVVDARHADRFGGSLQLPTDPQAGHIPGAVNVPCRENLDSVGRLRPIAEVREAFARVGVRDGSAVVSYCGSGITACHNLLALEHVGLGRGLLYPGGWSEYAEDPRRIAER